MEEVSLLFQEYIKECRFGAKLRPETVRGYQNVFDLFLRIVPEVTLTTLNSKVVVEFFIRLNERKRTVGKDQVKEGIKVSTTATYRSKLNHFFEWLKRRGHISTNPFEGMPYISPVYGDQRWLSKESLQKIFSAIITDAKGDIFLYKRNLLLFNILLFCGLRKSELLQLELRDIDLKRMTLTVRGETSKSKRTRVLPIKSEVMLHLEDYLEVRTKRKIISPFLFVSSTTDRGLSSDGLKHLIRNINSCSGVRFHPHRFRHTFAVNFLNKNGDVVKLQQLLGHRDIRMTAQYLRVLPTNAMRGDIETMNVDNML